MRTCFQIALAVFAGSIIGALIGLQLAEKFNFYVPVALTIGIVSGGFTAYLTYEWREVFSAFRRASRSVFAWRLNKEVWHRRFKLLYRGAAFAGVTGLCLGSVLVAPSFLFSFSPAMPAILIRFIVFASIFVLMYFMFFMMALLSDCGCVSGDDEKHLALVGDRRRMYDLMFNYLNIVVLPFWVCYGIYRGLAFVLPRVPLMVKRVVKVIKLTFINIHSEVRVLCAIYAAVGAGVGFFFGNPLVGGLIGVPLALVSYQLISIRWLKIASVRTEH